MNMPDRIGELLRQLLARIGVEKSHIVIDGARDHVEIELLRLARLRVHEELQTPRIGIGQPFIDGEAVALGLRYLLALLIEKELVVETVGWR